MPNGVFTNYEMDIKQILKLKVNDAIYGESWHNQSWVNSFKHQMKSMSVNKFKAIKGGAPDDGYALQVANQTQQPQQTQDVQQVGNVDLQNEIGFTIKDSFLKYNTNSMLFGKHITPYYAQLIVEVVKYYDSKNVKGNTQIKASIIQYVHRLLTNNPNINFNQLMKAFNAQTTECLLAYLLIAFQTNKLDLILRTTYTFGRVLPLKCKTEWFDNYRLNAYGNVLNMVLYKSYDRPGLFTINEDPLPINTNVKLDSYPRVIKYLVGSLRAFIIVHKLLPENIYDSVNNAIGVTGGSINSSSDIMRTGGENHDMNSFDFNEIIDEDAVAENGKAQTTQSSVPEFVNNDTLSNYTFENGSDPFSVSVGDVDIEGVDDGMSDELVLEMLKGAGKMTNEEVCDYCYLHYPFFFGGAHGCDVFDISTMSLTIDEITKFLERYPSARVGYILNTATYRSGRGQHWVALELTKGKAKLVCSQNSNFSVFDDGGRLKASLSRNMYGMEHNDRSIQRDNYACGTYAFISLMSLLRFGDIKKAVDSIGVNMESLGKEIGKESSADKVREKVVGWMSAYQ